LKRLQEKYTIHIASVTDTSIISLYYVEGINCKTVSVFLDYDNRVKFIGAGMPEEILSTIINNEMANTIK